MKTTLEKASAMADALADGTWRQWTQEQASEVADALDAMRRGAEQTELLRRLPLPADLESDLIRLWQWTQAHGEPVDPVEQGLRGARSRVAHILKRWVPEHVRTGSMEADACDYGGAMCRSIAPGEVAACVPLDSNGIARTPWCHLPKNHSGPCQCGTHRWRRT